MVKVSFTLQKRRACDARRALVNEVSLHLCFSYVAFLLQPFLHTAYLRRNPCVFQVAAKKFDSTPRIFYLLVPGCGAIGLTITRFHLAYFEWTGSIIDFLFCIISLFTLTCYVFSCATNGGDPAAAAFSPTTGSSSSTDAIDIGEHEQLLLGPASSSDRIRSLSPVAPCSSDHAPDLICKICHCLACNSNRPPRAHHCSLCQQCIYLRDHHCPWINNCVGQHNVHNFVLFVITLCLLSSFALLLTLG